MLSSQQPLILVTNDDGIRSPGLQATVEAVADLGEILVVAPRHQQTGAGRSISGERGQALTEEPFAVGTQTVPAYAIVGSPAMAMLYAMLVLAPRRPSLAIAGINYGENLGTDVSVSGTVGAALEAADLGVPALAISVEADKAFHYDNSAPLDFRAAQHFTRLFAQKVLACNLPPDVDVLKVDVPARATPDSPWRVTRQSRHRYHMPFARHHTTGAPPLMDYEAMLNFEDVEPDSDIWATRVDSVVSVTPLSLDMTSRVELRSLEDLLKGA